jgi:hypothetical protein
VGSAYAYVEGQGVVPKITIERERVEALPDRGLSVKAYEVVSRYLDKGMTGDALIEMVDRHERVVRGCDPDFARELRRSAKAIARLAYSGAC